MTARRRSGNVRISASARADFLAIIEWTVDRFGARQARAYAATINSAIAALARSPHVAGVRLRDDLAAGVCTLHIARGRRKGRHIIVFRTMSVGARETVDVLRILHDTMDLARHVDEA